MMRSQQWRPAVGDERREERWSISSAVTQRPDWLVRIMYTPTRICVYSTRDIKVGIYRYSNVRRKMFLCTVVT